MGALLQAVVLSLMVQAALFGVLTNSAIQKKNHFLQVETKDRDAMILSVERVLGNPTLCSEFLNSVALSQPIPSPGPLVIQDPELLIPAMGRSDLSFARGTRFGFVELQSVSLSVQDCSAGLSCPSGMNRQASIQWSATVTTGSRRSFSGTLGPFHVLATGGGRGVNACIYRRTSAPTPPTTTGGLLSLDCRAFGNSAASPGSGCINAVAQIQSALGLLEPGRPYPFALPPDEIFAPFSWEFAGQLGPANGCSEGTGLGSFTFNRGSFGHTCNALGLNLGNANTGCVEDSNPRSCYISPSDLRINPTTSGYGTTQPWVVSSPPAQCPPGTDWIAFFEHGQRRGLSCKPAAETPAFPACSSGPTLNSYTVGSGSSSYTQYCQRGAR